MTDLCLVSQFKVLLVPEIKYCFVKTADAALPYSIIFTMVFKTGSFEDGHFFISRLLFADTKHRPFTPKFWVLLKISPFLVLALAISVHKQFRIPVHNENPDKVEKIRFIKINSTITGK